MSQPTPVIVIYERRGKHYLNSVIGDPRKIGRILQEVIEDCFFVAGQMSKEGLDVERASRVIDPSTNRAAMMVVRDGDNGKDKKDG